MADTRHQAVAGDRLITGGTQRNPRLLSHLSPNFRNAQRRPARHPSRPELQTHDPLTAARLTPPMCSAVKGRANPIIHGARSREGLPVHRTAEPGSGSLPRPLRRMASALLDQQLWYLGMDIRRDDGNAPLAFGFRRVPSSDVRAATCYLLDGIGAPSLDGVTLGVWGFGLCCACTDGEATVVRRFGFAPRRPAPRGDLLPAWAPDDLGPIVSPVGRTQWTRCWVLLSAACGALAEYEAWALARFGITYRHWCLAGRPKLVRRRMLAPHAVPDRWRALAAWCDTAASAASGVVSSAV